MIFMGLGVTIGSISVAVCTQYYNPFINFWIGAVVTFFIMLSGFSIPDELETNKYALMQSDEEKMFTREEGVDI